MGYLAQGEIFENMLQFKRFAFYFEVTNWIMATFI